MIHLSSATDEQTLRDDIQKITEEVAKAIDSGIKIVVFYTDFEDPLKLRMEFCKKVIIHTEASVISI